MCPLSPYSLSQGFSTSHPLLNNQKNCQVLPHVQVTSRLPRLWAWLELLEPPSLCCCLPFRFSMGAPVFLPLSWKPLVSRMITRCPGYFLLYWPLSRDRAGGYLNVQIIFKKNNNQKVRWLEFTPGAPVFQQCFFMWTPLESALKLNMTQNTE